MNYSVQDYSISIPDAQNSDYIDGLVHDCGISSANALEIPQSCTKPSIYPPQWVASVICLHELTCLDNASIIISSVHGDTAVMH